MCFFFVCVYQCEESGGKFSTNTFHDAQLSSCNSSLFSSFPPFSFPHPSLAHFNRRKNYPGCPLISPENFFPGWKHYHPFSLHCPPFPLLSVSNDYPGGNWAREQYASGEPSRVWPKNTRPLPAFFRHPSTYPSSPLMPFHYPTKTLQPRASRIWWQSPKSISEEFPCWNLYQLQMPLGLSAVCENP